MPAPEGTKYDELHQISPSPIILSKGSQYNTNFRKSPKSTGRSGRFLAGTPDITFTHPSDKGPINEHITVTTTLRKMVIHHTLRLNASDDGSLRLCSGLPLALQQQQTTSAQQQHRGGFGNLRIGDAIEPDVTIGRVRYG